MTDFGTEIGVLLPVRLETRLDVFTEATARTPDEVGHARLRVLVVPDAPSVDPHQPTVADSELDLLDAAYEACAGDLTTDAGAAAFDDLAGAVGAGRAAWLLRQFRAVPDAGAWRADRTGAEVRELLADPVLRGLPDQLELWAVVPDGRVLLLAWEPAARDLPVTPPTDPDQVAAGTWWADWATAEQAGLTAVVDLDDPALPLPVVAEQIEALVLQGLSGDEPGPLFTAHADAGSLELSAAGTPTNTVAGAPTTGRDPQRFLERVTGTAGPDARAVSALLTGDADVLGPLPGGEQEHDAGQAALVGATWPALVGHPVKDLWGFDGGDGRGTIRLGRWAQAALRPDGPLPPVLVRGQPYGVLPVTALDRWDGDGDAWDVEAFLAALVRSQTPAGARRAEDTLGTVVGASADRAYELLAQVPTSGGYTTQSALPLDVLAAVLSDPNATDQMVAWWDAQAARLVVPPLPRPDRPTWALGWPWPLRIPLLAPSVDDGPGPMLEALFEEGMSKDPDDWHRDLLRWLVDNCGELAAAQRLAGDLFGRPDRLPDSLLFRVCLMSLLLSWSEVARSTRGLVGPLREQEEELYGRLTDVGNDPVDDEVLRQVRTVLESVDLLAQGTDPAAAVERRFRGVLDAPALRLDAVATALPWRRLTTAPYDTAPRSLGLYGWVDRPFAVPSLPGPTQGGLLLAPSDAQARTALVLRDRSVHDRSVGVDGAPRWSMELASAQVRLAAEVVEEVRSGSHPGEALGRLVEAVLDAYGPVRAARDRWRIRPEHAGRRTCDGLALLRETDADVVAAVGPLTAGQLAALAHLRTFAATVADLLLAQGVWDVVQGRFDQAGAATEAAAGLAEPPDLQVLRTRRTSTPRSTAVAVALPEAAAPAGPDDSPVALADPAVAAWVAAESAASGFAWMTSAGDVTLADLGLAPVDCLVLADDDLARLAAAAAGAAVTAAPDGPRRVRRLAATLHSTPPSRPALAPGTTAPPDDPLDPAPELASRYAAVRAAATALRDELAGPAGDGLGGEPLPLLQRALRWGVAPVPADEVDLAELRMRAAAGLADRLAAPPPGPAASAAALTSATGELVGPGGRVPVLGRVAVADLPTLAPSPTGALGRPAVDADWLEVVSAVRPALAAVDAHQAGAVHRGGTPWSAWTSRPDDVWQHERGEGPGDQLLVAYGPAGALGGPTVALGVLDVFTEQVPDEGHPAAAALAFNTPGARAPQAILVVVTPQVDATLDSDTLLEALLETRELARVRLLRPEDAGPWDAAALALLPADFRAGFRPEPEGAWPR